MPWKIFDILLPFWRNCLPLQSPRCRLVGSEIFSRLEVIDPDGNSLGPITGLVLATDGKPTSLRQALRDALEPGYNFRSTDKE